MHMTQKNYEKRILSALKKTKADLVLKHATYLNVFTNEFLEGDIAITNGYFAGIGSYDGHVEIDCTNKTVVPGFLDAHIHLESTTVRPDIFAKEALKHGTTTVITDPHEIANVLGTDGIDYMMQITKDLPLDVFFMIPSCVPSCRFDESGAVIDSVDIRKYLNHDRILGLAEMMNAPGIFNNDRETLLKIHATLDQKKIIDGHAPNTLGTNLQAYISSGIYSDHECTNPEEALQKLRSGQWIMIREGTASKNLASLFPLCKEPYASRCMFATDDRHISDIMEEGHIDHIIRTAIAGGVKKETAYKMASFQPCSYFGLSRRGAIAPGYLADLVILDDVEKVKVHSVYKKGRLMDETNRNKRCVMSVDKELNEKVHKTVNINPVTETDFALKRIPEKVIGLIPHELLTTDEGMASDINIEKDIVKVCVVERHKLTGHIGICLLKGYGLKEGAIATSIAHDAHNIIAAGTNDKDIAFAVNRLHDMEGGIVVVKEENVLASLSLPIAGLMGEQSAKETSDALKILHEKAYSLGVSKSIDPFMTLSFVSLPVIPKLKLTTLGVVDVEKFELI